MFRILTSVKKYCLENMKQLITLSKPAIEACRKIISQKPDKVLKLSLKGGGCNGFEYRFQLTEPEINTDEKVTIDDIDIYVCSKSLVYLIGTKIDFKTSIMGTHFDFNNPNAQATCGCGTSFSPRE